MSRGANRNKKKSKKEEYIPPTRTERIIILGFGLILIIGSLYLGLRSNKISEDDLTTVKVTLSKDPEFDEYRIKSTTYRDIILRTREYKREFRITGMTYESTDIEAVRSEIKINDVIDLKLITDDMDEINDNTFSNNYNIVLGMSKGTKSYIDLEDRKELVDSDSKWAFAFTVLGLIFLPYGLMKKEPIIDIEKAIYSAAFVGLIIILIIAFG